jgi:hypothetical protein
VNKFKASWQQAFLQKNFVYEFYGAVVVLIITMILFSKFVLFVEMRTGAQLNDPLLHSFNALNLTWPIFLMIYGAIFYVIYILIYFPHKLVHLFEAYVLMIIIRMLTMYFLPLEPPNGIIILSDPFVELFGNGKALTKDLFFSGHTASLFLFFLCVPKKKKWIFLILTTLVALGVLLQKVHYTIDILVAPFISLGCYYMTSRRLQKLIMIA